MFDITNFYAHPTKMLVATITTQRSGSKFLGNCFLAGTAVSPFGEIFNPETNHAGSFNLFKNHREFDLKNQGGFSILDEYFQSMEGIRGIVQFDIMYNQLEIPNITWNPYINFFIYGFLKERHANVVHLKRSVVDTYLSMKYLECMGGSGAHNFSGRNDYIGDGNIFELDYSDFFHYFQYNEWHEKRLYEAMDGYEWFTILPYDEISKTGRIPNFIRDSIVENAKFHKININSDNIQMREANIFKSNLDYENLFSNYESFVRHYRDLSGVNPNP